MTTQHPEHDGSDLAKLREDIDALKAIPVERLVDPEPAALLDNEPKPRPSGAIGSMGSPAHFDKPED